LLRSHSPIAIYEYNGLVEPTQKSQSNHEQRIN
jgi:hypothetical protein